MACALERARYEYTELCDNWKQLETKAQGTAAIAGVFLAAFVAIASRHSCGDLDIHFKLTVVALIALLLASIYHAVKVLRVTEFDMPPSSESTWADVKKLLDLPLNDEALRREMEKLQREFVDIWVQCNQTLHACNEKKSSSVRRAQRLLVWSAFFGALVGVTYLFYPFAH